MTSSDESSCDEANEAADRTTYYLLSTLGNDYDKCYSALISTMDNCELEKGEVTSDDTNFNSRMLIHSAFAYIEGAASYLKYECLFAEDDGRTRPSPVEVAYIMDVEYRLTDNGTIKERPAKIPLKTNVSFAFTTYERLFGNPGLFDSSMEWFSALGNAIKVRDRITHPKNPCDLDIMPNEVIDTVKAVSGMMDTLSRELIHAHPELKATYEKGRRQES